MTTETTARSTTRFASAGTGPRGAVGTQLRTGALVLALGLAASLVGVVLSGPPAALGALVGTLLIVVVLVGGSVMLDLVATVLPAASLLIAMLTYTLQLLVLLLVLLALERSSLLGSELDRAWLGGAVIAATAAWTAAQLRVHLTRRIPVWDLRPGPDEGGPQ